MIAKATKIKERSAISVMATVLEIVDGGVMASVLDVVD